MLVASVMLHQVTTVLAMFSGFSQRDTVKAARNRLYYLQSRRWAKSNQLGSKGIVFV